MTKNQWMLIALAVILSGFSLYPHPLKTIGLLDILQPKTMLTWLPWTQVAAQRQ
jgi:hypothetical protein